MWGDSTAQWTSPCHVVAWKKGCNTNLDVSCSWSPRGVEEGKRETKAVCVIHYNQHMRGVDKKDQLLQTYLEERKRMNKWYMRSFRRLLNATVLNSLVIYRQNTGRNIDHLKLVKYSVQRRISGNHDGDKTFKRLTERHFPRRVPSTEKKCKPMRRCVVCRKHNKRRNCVLLSRLWCCSVRRWVFWGLPYKEKLLK